MTAETPIPVVTRTSYRQCTGASSSFLFGTIAQEEYSVGVTKQCFNLIFFMGLIKKRHEALIGMDVTRASQEPPVRGDLTGRQEHRGNEMDLQTIVFHESITGNNVTL
jgi:hypothetical protein